MLSFLNARIITAISLMLCLPLGLFFVEKVFVPFPVQHVLVEGDVLDETRSEIEKIVTQQTTKGLLSFNVINLQKALSQLPWVDKVAIQRLFPNRLHLKIKNKKPMARWGNVGLLDQQGRLFFPKMTQVVETDLPVFLGEQKNITDIYAFYLNIKPLFLDLGVKIKTLHLDSDGSWYIMLANGVTVGLGNQALDERLKRLVLSYPKLLKLKARKIAYVDLRYTNGIAVGCQ